MGMMGNPGGPFGGPYAGQGNQGLGGAGLGPQLQSKGPMANSLAQFNVDKKNQPMQGMAAMVGNTCKLIGGGKNVYVLDARMSCTTIFLPSWQI